MWLPPFICTVIISNYYFITGAVPIKNKCNPTPRLQRLQQGLSNYGGMALPCSAVMQYIKLNPESFWVNPLLCLAHNFHCPVLLYIHFFPFHEFIHIFMMHLFIRSFIHSCVHSCGYLYVFLHIFIHLFNSHVHPCIHS